MTKIILISFSVIFLFSCGREKLACETNALEEAIRLSFNKNSSIIDRLTVDSIKFKFIEPSLGKDSIQKNIFRKKICIQKTLYSFAFKNIVISKKSRIYISILNQQYVISEIELAPYEKKYFTGSSEMGCTVKSYKVNGMKSIDYPFVVNVNM